MGTDEQPSLCRIPPTKLAQKKLHKRLRYVLNALACQKIVQWNTLDCIIHSSTHIPVVKTPQNRSELGNTHVRENESNIKKLC
jgi:hypothetical protein